MKKILVVDDNVFFAKTISDTLPKDKYTVVTAEDGEDGLKKLQSEKPDLVLLDILMPKIDGIEFLKILQSKRKKNAGELPVPIIITSNLSNMNKISEGVSLGVKGYIVKSDENLQSIASSIEQILQSEENARKKQAGK
ncbi:MAG: phoP [Parcubacteria group bacterium]|nr:phoP [Parcubacteria group bacterium]